MIDLNGHKAEFFAASGALGYTGDGYWWEQPLRWFGYIRPKELTIITKTLTLFPRKGNLRWYAPWRCVKFIRDGVVNCVGLTNPGYQNWLVKSYPKVQQSGYKVIVSVAANNAEEASYMADDFNRLKNIVGIELNVNCPNVPNNKVIAHYHNVIGTMQKKTRHPLIIKMGFTDPYLEICKEWDGKVVAFDLINAVPYRWVFKDGYSPLAKHGLVGSVSGLPICEMARKALRDVKDAGVKTPVISGGGLYSLEEVKFRRDLGADGFAFGTLFLRKPWMPAKIIKEYHDS